MKLLSCPEMYKYSNLAENNTFDNSVDSRTKLILLKLGGIAFFVVFISLHANESLYTESTEDTLLPPTSTMKRSRPVKPQPNVRRGARQSRQVAVKTESGLTLSVGHT